MGVGHKNLELNLGNWEVIVIGVYGMKFPNNQNKNIKLKIIHLFNHMIFCFFWLECMYVYDAWSGHGDQKKVSEYHSTHPDYNNKQLWAAMLARNWTQILRKSSQDSTTEPSLQPPNLKILYYQIHSVKHRSSKTL